MCSHTPVRRLKKHLNKGWNLKEKIILQMSYLFGNVFTFDFFFKSRDTE